jgi:protein required for attachment to host cells
MENWILIADAARAFAFVPLPVQKELRQVREFIDPLGRAKGADMLEDRPGRTRNPGSRSVAPALQSHTDIRAVQAVQFARHLAQELKRARQGREFEQLALIAPPQFLGLLRHALDGELSKIVVASAAMDLTSIPPRDLWPHVQGILKAFSHLVES